MITITLPDGSKKQVPPGSSALDVAKTIGPRLAMAAIAAKVNGELVDITKPIEQDSTLQILTFKDPEGLEVFRHSTAHVFAYAIQELFPNAKNTIGPAVEEGFYYDFDDLKITEEDFARIEAKMQEIIAKDLPCKRVELSLDEVKKTFPHNPYKVEMASEFALDSKKLSAYKIGDGFIDLCRGPHIPSTGMIKAFKINKIAGAYWRGDAKNKQLTRIYGISFADPKQLKEYLALQEEIARRDHRKIGKELEIFHISEDIGPGLVLWLPKGNIIKEQLENWAKETEEVWGYTRVTTPVITKEGLFHTSEHLPHYSESMFPPMEMDGERYYIKPMNCPFHHSIYKVRSRSYRELPLRLAEYGWCHRYEQSGAIIGLMRVRGMQMNDAHIYCTKEQAVKEFVDVIKLHEYYYKILGIKDYWMELALRNPDNAKYHGDDDMWKEAEELMRKAMDLSGVKYIVQNDGAAFYGPKIDFQIKSVIGRTFTASTNQIDLFMPKKFDLTYMGEDGKEHRPVVIHRAPLGTHERFVGFLIEHFAGRFPLWLNPVQVRLLPIADRHLDYTNKIAKELRDAGLRVEVDADANSLNKKIRDAQIAQINYIVVIGDKEQENTTVNVRTRTNNVLGELSLEDFRKKLLDEVKNKALPENFSN